MINLNRKSLVEKLNKEVQVKSKLVPMTTTAPVMTIRYFALRLTAWYRGLRAVKRRLGEFGGATQPRAQCLDEPPVPECKVKAGCTDVRMVDIEVTASDETGLEEQRGPTT